MRRQIKLSPKQRIAATCGFSALALVGLIGGLYSINASADGEEQYAIKLPNTTINGNDVTWSLPEDNTVTIGLQSGLNVTTTPENKISFANFNDVKNGFYGYANGIDLCSSESPYELVISHPSGFSATNHSENGITCTYTPANEYGGNVSEIGLSQNINLPNEYATFEVRLKNNNQQNNSTIIVSIATDSFGQDGKTATFNFGNESRSITFTNAWNTEK